MSTHSYIGIQTNDGSIRAIYCHFDGYLNGVGAELVSQFSTQTLAEALIEDGDCRFPGDPYKNRSGENWDTIKPKQHDDLEGFLQGKGRHAGHYAYLFINDEWFLVQDHYVTVSVKDALSAQKSG